MKHAFDRFVQYLQKNYFSYPKIRNYHPIHD